MSARRIQGGGRRGLSGLGIVLVLIMAWRARRGAFSPAYYAPLEVVGLYWSFVDIVWVFLFAAIYPLGRVAA